MPIDLPIALFASCCNVQPTETIKKVLNGQLPELLQIDPITTAYQWDIDNKYYTASINLCSLAEKQLSTRQISNLVEAIIIYFDSEDIRGLDLVESWLSYLEVNDPDIKILVCKNCTEDGDETVDRITKLAAQEWCIQRGFELVELEPCLDDIDPDDDFLETTGVERIRQALNAHRWPNLMLKPQGDVNGGVRQALDSPSTAEDLEDILLSGAGLADLAPDFATLFSQLSEIKSQLATLSGDERKEAAERVVRDFWMAMGGDGEELDELQLLRMLPE